MSDISKIVTQLETDIAALADVLPLEKRLAAHVKDAKTFDAEHPFAAADRRDAHLQKLDAERVRTAATQLADVSGRRLDAAVALGHAWEQAAEAPSETDRLFAGGSGVPVSQTDRNQARLLDELRIANFATQLAASTLPEVAQWYHAAKAADDTAALKYLDQQQRAGWPTVRRLDREASAKAAGHLAVLRQETRAVRVATTHGHLVEARVKLRDAGKTLDGWRAERTAPSYRPLTYAELSARAKPERKEYRSPLDQLIA